MPEARKQRAVNVTTEKLRRSTMGVCEELQEREKPEVDSDALAAFALSPCSGTRPGHWTFQATGVEDCHLSSQLHAGIAG